MDGTEEGRDVSHPVYRVECASCRALLFISRIRWFQTGAARGIVAIKCWRCRRVVSLSPVEGSAGNAEVTHV